MLLPASRLLDLWAAARDDTWAGCAVRLAEAGRAAAGATAPADDGRRATPEPIGRTVAALLRLPGGFAGGVLAATAVCADCEEELEFALPVADLLALEPEVRVDAGTVPVDGRELGLRPPGFADLDAVAGEAPERRSEALARRCVEGDVPARLDDAVVAAIEAAVEAADPLVEIRVGLTCPECGAGLDAEVDVVAHVWAEVEARAREVVAEVDVLARAYGWSEREILALDEARRRLYLEYLGEPA
jgi:hypothetical protein